MRRTAQSVIACLVAAIAAVGVAAAQAPDRVEVPDTAVVARVDGRAITAERFERSYVQHLIRTGRNDTVGERYAHLDELIDTYLFAEAARTRGLDEAPAFGAFEERQIKDAVGEKFYAVALLDTLPDLTERELRAAYLRARDRVTVRHLFFRTKAEARAAYERLEAGEDFVALANEVFETAAFDASAGLLGEIGYWDVADAFAEAAFSLPVGAYSEPVRTPYGWHVVRVDDRFLDPLPTESDYLNRRGYIRSQARLRRMRTAGDVFVRDFMEGLGVTVDEAAMRALRDIVRETVRAERGDAPDATLGRDEVAALGAGLRPETVLASFTLDGQSFDFTAGDYVAWLPALPGSEVRHRTAASVGRALRNEALALAGLARGLAADAGVLEAVDHATAGYLADALRDSLRAKADVAPSEPELRRAYTALGFDGVRAATADYWRIPFGDVAAAESALAAIASGTRTPASYGRYGAFEGDDLLDGASPELDAHLRRAPLGRPVVLGAADGTWYVLEVARRDEVRATFDEARDDLVAAITPYVPELRLRERLRASAAVEVNHDVFERLMRSVAEPAMR